MEAMLFQEFAISLYFVFFFALFLVFVQSNNFRRLFFPMKKIVLGARHRMVALVYLSWLLVGVVTLCIADEKSNPSEIDAFRVSHFLGYNFGYHVILGVLGISLTLTAAFDFISHKKVKNHASGVLDQDATITYDEMIEHSFYQILNLVQVVFFHSMKIVGPVHVNDSFNWLIRAALVILVTSPWLFRGYFPVNSFSANYQKGDSQAKESSTPRLHRILYRLKKYQYLLYKHFLLHSLNITVALLNDLNSRTLVDSWYFRLYWISLNTSYTMEFFLQTLVKKHYIKQDTMLILNQMLMLISTIAALHVIYYHVNIPLAFVSLVSNLVHRKHDILNTTILIASVAAYRAVWS